MKIKFYFRGHKVIIYIDKSWYKKFHYVRFPYYEADARMWHVWFFRIQLYIWGKDV